MRRTINAASATLRSVIARRSIMTATSMIAEHDEGPLRRDARAGNGEIDGADRQRARRRPFADRPVDAPAPATAPAAPGSARRPSRRPAPCASPEIARMWPRPERAHRVLGRFGDAAPVAHHQGGGDLAVVARQRRDDPLADASGGCARRASPGGWPSGGGRCRPASRRHRRSRPPPMPS